MKRSIFLLVLLGSSIVLASKQAADIDTQVCQSLTESASDRPFRSDQKDVQPLLRILKQCCQ